MLYFTPTPDKAKARYNCYRFLIKLTLNVYLVPESFIIPESLNIDRPLILRYALVVATV